MRRVDCNAAAGTASTQGTFADYLARFPGKARSTLKRQRRSPQRGTGVGRNDLPALLRIDGRAHCVTQRGITAKFGKLL
jgi:hypothetical protein